LDDRHRIGDLYLDGITSIERTCAPSDSRLRRIQSLIHERATHRLSHSRIGVGKGGAAGGVEPGLTHSGRGGQSAAMEIREDPQHPDQRNQQQHPEQKGLYNCLSRLLSIGHGGAVLRVEVATASTGSGNGTGPSAFSHPLTCTRTTESAPIL
jgi:hypothetical protein